LYGIVAQVPIGDLFLGGFLPGLLMLGALAALGVREGLVAGTSVARSRYARRLPRPGRRNGNCCFRS
jgi:TRAP-type C4-dicarboxylate transport system permease large subunit